MPELPGYNLDEIPDAGGLPPGIYLAKVVKVDEAISHSGQPMLKWMWKIIDGEHTGHVFLDYISLQDHMLDMYKRYLKAFGFSGEVEPDTDNLAGKEACLITGQKTIISKTTGEPTDLTDVLSVLPADRFAQLTSQQGKYKEK